MRRPCNNCPWRVDAPREHWDPQHFLDIYRDCQDDGLKLMLCHKAMALPEPERGSLPCQGWARVMGTRAIGVRIALMQGKLLPEEVADRKGPRLFRSFLAMLRANRVTPPVRNELVPIRRRRVR